MNHACRPCPTPVYLLSFVFFLTVPHLCFSTCRCVRRVWRRRRRLHVSQTATTTEFRQRQLTCVQQGACLQPASCCWLSDIARRTVWCTATAPLPRHCVLHPLAPHTPWTVGRRWNKKKVSGPCLHRLATSLALSAITMCKYCTRCAHVAFEWELFSFLAGSVCVHRVHETIYRWNVNQQICERTNKSQEVCFSAADKQSSVS